MVVGPSDGGCVAVRLRSSSNVIIAFGALKQRRIVSKQMRHHEIFTTTVGVDGAAPSVLPGVQRRGRRRGAAR